MKSSLFKIFVVLPFLFITVALYSAQKNDTVFYSKNKIRSIETTNKKSKKLIAFFSTTGENLLVQDNFKYTYFDSTMLTKKDVVVENNSINQEYWVFQNDTIYDIATFDKAFDSQVQKFINYTRRNIIYPSHAQRQGIQGSVHVSFIVNKNGKITNLKALTNLGNGFEDEALKVVQQYGDWGCITVNNKKINCYLTLPVNFVLK